jgi:hypothetical protein
VLAAVAVEVQLVLRGLVEAVVVVLVLVSGRVLLELLTQAGVVVAQEQQAGLQAVLAL